MTQTARRGMFQRMKLWWQDLWDEEQARCAEEEYEEYMEAQREIERIRKERAGNCPECGTELVIGVTDYTVGRTCTNCHYHDFSFIHPEAEDL